LGWLNLSGLTAVWVRLPPRAPLTGPAIGGWGLRIVDQTPRPLGVHKPERPDRRWMGRAYQRHREVALTGRGCPATGTTAQPARSIKPTGPAGPPYETWATVRITRDPASSIRWDGIAGGRECVVARGSGSAVGALQRSGDRPVGSWTMQTSSRSP